MRSERVIAILIKQVDVERYFSVVETLEFGITSAYLLVALVLKLLDFLNGADKKFLLLLNSFFDCLDSLECLIALVHRHRAQRWCVRVHIC